MKGRNIFTQGEISELKRLIKERIKADKSRQKIIRAKMRKIGFYGLDDFGIIDLQPADFEMLINSGRVKILGQTLAAKSTPKRKIIHLDKPSLSNETEYKFTLFDPCKNFSDQIPDSPGNYLICLKCNSNLPDIGIKPIMKKYQNLNVIYTGITSKSLRKRDYKQHFTGNNAGSSTLRKSLGSLFGFPKIARDKDTSNGKTKFKEDDEIKLSQWMQSNLVLFFMSSLNPDRLEDELIYKFNPPLNLSKNKSIENQNFRRKLSELRNIR